MLLVCGLPLRALGVAPFRFVAPSLKKSSLNEYIFFFFFVGSRLDRQIGTYLWDFFQSSLLRDVCFSLFFPSFVPLLQDRSSFYPCVEFSMNESAGMPRWDLVVSVYGRLAAPLFYAPARDTTWSVVKRVFWSSAPPRSYSYAAPVVTSCACRMLLREGCR